MYISIALIIGMLSLQDFAKAETMSDACLAALSDPQTSIIDSKVLDELVIHFQDNKDPVLRQRIMMSFHSMAKKWATKYCRRFGKDFADQCYKEGLLGIERALEKFDRDKGVSFRTYAPWWIRQKILNWRGTQRGVIYIPENEDADRARKQVAEFKRSLTPEQTRNFSDLQSYFDALNIPENVQDLIHSQNAAYQGKSLDSGTKAPGGRSLILRISDTLTTEIPSPESASEVFELRAKITTLLEEFARKHIDGFKHAELRRALLFERIYPISVLEVPFNKEVGERFGYSESDSKRIEDKLIVQLKGSSFAKTLASFFGRNQVQF